MLNYILSDFKLAMMDALLASKVITSFSSNWITLLLLCTIAPLVLCCDRFNRGSRHANKRDPVNLVTVDYDMTLHWRINLVLKRNLAERMCTKEMYRHAQQLQDCINT